MAGNTRGKLKEHLEGIHRNYGWVIDHVQKSLVLIGDKNPKLSEGLKAVAEQTNMFDDLVMELYSHL